LLDCGKEREGKKREEQTIGGLEGGALGFLLNKHSTFCAIKILIKTF